MVSPCKSYISEYLKSNPHMKEGGLPKFVREHDEDLRVHRKPDMWCVRELQDQYCEFEVEWHEVVYSNDLKPDKISEMMYLQDMSDVVYFRFFKHDLNTGVVFEFGQDWLNHDPLWLEENPNTDLSRLTEDEILANRKETCERVTSGMRSLSLI